MINSKYKYGTPSTLAFIDLETTGKPSDRVVELCVALVSSDGTQKGPYTRRFCPPTPILWYATKVHGIKDADVKNEKKFPERASDLHKILKDTILVAHAAPQCETPVLTKEFSEANQPWPFAGVIDTLSLSRKLWPNAGAWSVSSLINSLRLVPAQAHTAEGDVRMLMQIWDVIYTALGPKSLPINNQLISSK